MQFTLIVDGNGCADSASEFRLNQQGSLAEIERNR
jgi:hypothetical protein